MSDEFGNTLSNELMAFGKEIELTKEDIKKISDGLVRSVHASNSVFSSSLSSVSSLTSTPRHQEEKSNQPKK